MSNQLWQSTGRLLKKKHRLSLRSIASLRLAYSLWLIAYGSLVSIHMP
jgi:hypothetical protein